jgi:hypothetical protein
MVKYCRGCLYRVKSNSAKLTLINLQETYGGGVSWLQGNVGGGNAIILLFLRSAPTSAARFCACTTAQSSWAQEISGSSGISLDYSTFEYLLP